ncbi:hypothetical protein BURPS305_3835 [Burkholderia pseudomallei 305]|nr:hypothetical protein BURPS305_3835 [Burkholderia pseudomallei 305]
MAGRPTEGGARRRGRTDGRRFSGGFRRSFARHAGAFFQRAAAIRQPRVGGAQSAGREEERVRAGRENAEPA